MSAPVPGVTGELPTKSGLLKATIVPGVGKNQIGSVKFGGTIKADADALASLELALADASIDEAPGTIEDFFSQNPDALPGVEPEEFLTVLTLAFMKVRRSASTAPDPSAWKKNP